MKTKLANEVWISTARFHNKYNAFKKRTKEEKL